jgi:hypothetical protein
MKYSLYLFVWLKNIMHIREFRIILFYVSTLIFIVQNLLYKKHMPKAFSLTMGFMGYANRYLPPPHLLFLWVYGICKSILTPFLCVERERAGALNLSNQVKILTGVIIEVFDKLNSFF